MPEPTAALVSAVPEPFTTNGDLDDAGLKPLYRFLDAAGLDGVFTAGTTGEFTALDDAERDTVLTEALAVFGPERVYHHVGAASAHQAERLTDRAVALGARNLPAITPYYLPAGPQALVDYYQRLGAAAGGARIFVYLYRARSTTTVTPAQLAELAKIPSVAGAKISREPTSRVMEYVRAAPDGFVVYSGNDIEFGDFVRAGGAGGVSGVSSVFPEPFVALADALTRGDEQAAAAAQDRMKRAVEAVGGADIALIKTGLSTASSTVPPARRRSPSRAGDDVLTHPIVPAGTPAPSDPDQVDGVEDHKDAGSKGGRKRCSPQPVLGAANAVVDPTVRRAAGRVTDNEQALVADPDPTLIEISRFGRRPRRRGSRPNRPAVVAGSETDADGDQVRIGGVAVHAVSAGEGLDAHRGARRNPRPGRLAPGLLPHSMAPRLRGSFTDPAVPIGA